MGAVEGTCSAGAGPQEDQAQAGAQRRFASARSNGLRGRWKIGRRKRTPPNGSSPMTPPMRTRRGWREAVVPFGATFAAAVACVSESSVARPGDGRL
eukprot:scaffold69163_cov30-Tisochrysis_lutea.AAC.2